MKEVKGEQTEEQKNRGEDRNSKENSNITPPQKMVIKNKMKSQTFLRLKQKKTGMLYETQQVIKTISSFSTLLVSALEFYFNVKHRYQYTIFKVIEF